MHLGERGPVFVIDTGSPRPGAPTLLLFHGLATTSYLTWFSTISDLSGDYRCVLIDQRWHGRGIVSERFRLDDCIDDAVAVLDRLGIDTVIAVGYSMGGALAQVFAKQHPERTAGLVLASTSACWKRGFGEAMFYPVLNVTNSRFHPFFRSKVAASRAALVHRAHTVEDGAIELSTWAWAEFRSTSPWALPEVLGELGRFDGREWLTDLDVPVAVVITAKDKAIPTARQREMAASIPSAAVYEAPGGHASVVFDVDRWRPLFLEAVANVADRLPINAAPIPTEQAGA
jgi:pimeloyl-ACP methyl ester carboxylesterase